MADRITEKQLRALVDRLNRETGSPLEAYTKGDNGRYHANIGNYHLDCAYSGFTLARMVNESGGITHPIGWGRYFTKRELWFVLQAFMDGIEEGKRLAHSQGPWAGNGGAR